MRWPFFKAGSLFPANAIGVDLGTANTLIYVKGEGIVLNEPSVVAQIDRDSKKIKGVRTRSETHARGERRMASSPYVPMKDGVIASTSIVTEEKCFGIFSRADHREPRLQGEAARHRLCAFWYYRS